MLFHLLDTLAHDTLVENHAEEHTHTHTNNDRDTSHKVRNNSQPRSEYTIEMFGVAKDGKPVHIQVDGFFPSFYVMLPKESDEPMIKSIVLNKLRNQFAKCEECFTDFHKYIKFERVKRRQLFGYTANKEFPMLQISVRSRALFYKAKGLFLDKSSKQIMTLGGRVVEAFEANLDPMLRFFHIQNIEPCGWVDVECEVEFDDINETYTGVCDYTKVVPPKSKPAPAGSVKMVSWDIECYSESGEFPLPEKDSDAVIQVGCVITQAGKPTEKHCFVLGSCDPVPDVVIHVSKTEKDLLLDWAGHICEWDPDIMVGYNVFGFDERYLWARALKLGITDYDAFQRFSRLEGEEVKLTEKMLSSSALGDNRLYMWNTPGRLQIDLYHYIKRLEALPSYKLDDVTSHYMSGKLKAISAKPGGLISLKTSVSRDVRIGRSIKILDETGEAIAEKCEVVEIGQGEIIVRPQEEVEPTDLESAKKWAIVKDDVPPAEIFRLHREGGSAGRAKVADYCVQDCNLVVEIFNKLDVFNNAMSMANVCSVPVNYIFTRGQGIKIESLIFKECHYRNQVVKVLESPPGAFGSSAVGEGDEEKQEESYEGAIVFDPIPDFYFESPVGVCDFASLYPSSIISENISYDTLVWAKDYDKNGNWKYSYGGEPRDVEPGVQWTDIEFDIWGTKEGDVRKNPEKERKGLRVCRYAQLPNDKKGTLPDILMKLLAARKAKRKEAEKESDPFRKAILDAEQLAYKLTANSLYGQLGSATFKVRLQHLAASTTAYGRKQITFAKVAIETFYGPTSGRKDCSAEIVYGDTDSLFVNFNPRDEAGKRLEGRESLVRTIELTEECGKYVTQTLKAPHDFEYDKVFWPFIIFSKKRYVGNKYEENPDEFKETSMGIVLKRRDNASIVKTIYGGAIKILMNKRNVPEAAEFVRKKCKELGEGKVSMSQLTITKSLRDSYADPTRIAHKVLADRIKARDPGNAPASGDRIPYVYIQTDKSVTLQGNKIELPSYVKEHNLKPDVEFYITNQLSNPISQLFALRVEEIPGYTHVEWPENPDKRAVARERLAAELLFGQTLRSVDTVKRNEAATKMGFLVQPRQHQQNASIQNSIHMPAGSRIVNVEAVPIAGPKKQMVIDSWLATSMALESSTKQKKQSKEDGSKTKPASKSTNSTNKKT